MRKAIPVLLSLFAGLTLLAGSTQAQQPEKNIDQLLREYQAAQDALKAKQPKAVPPALGLKGAPPPKRGRGYVPLTPEKMKLYHAISHAKHGGRIAMLARNQTLPSSFDCNARYPLAGWDQGQCGSCYEVSTARTMTCSLGLAGYGKADSSFMMSAQYGMDSPRDFGGCDGGNGTEVVDWAIKNGWIAETYIDAAGVVHNDYPPYEAQSGRDRTKSGARVWMKDATWGFVTNGKFRVSADGKRLHLAAAPTDQIKAALVNFGRLNISLDAGGQFSNGSGTITSLGSNVDHEINLRAYDDSHDNGNGTKGAFLLENQWGEDWGDNGCIWCSYKAAQNIVDVFFVSASPLPPPPPVPPTPPVPPDPPEPPIPPVPPVPPLPPGSNKQLTLSGWGSVDGVYIVTDKASHDANVLDLQRLLDRLNGTPNKETLPAPKPAPQKSPQSPTPEPPQASFDAKLDAVIQALHAYHPPVPQQIRIVGAWDAKGNPVQFQQTK